MTVLAADALAGLLFGVGRQHAQNDRHARLAPDLAAPTRIAFEHVVRSGIDVDVDIDAKKTNAFAWETWLRRNFVEKLPGGKGSGEKGK